MTEKIEIIAGDTHYYDEPCLDLNVSKLVANESIAVPDVGKSTVLFQIPSNLAKCTITPTPKENGTFYRVLLYGTIEAAKDYMSLFRIMSKCTENDEVEVNIDSPGGDIRTAIAIRNSIYSSKAHKVNLIALGDVMSAATLIYNGTTSEDGRFTCNIGKYAHFMFHMSSHGIMGNTVRVIEESKLLLGYVDDYLKDSIKNNCITPEEYDLISNKQIDVYITAKQMAERLNKQII